MSAATASITPRDPTCHFAVGISAYKLFWVFVIGSFVGFLVETSFVLITQGEIACRSNILLTPLNAIYGVGALTLHLTLRNISQHNGIIFVVGVLSGTLVEYACSWFQDTIFGTVSWDYTHLPLDINGRVCLLYSVFWGLLAIVWAKLLQPRLDKGIVKIPNKVARPLTWAVAAYLASAIVFTILAFTRWNLRMAGIPASNGFTQWIDLAFPDSFMQVIYATLQHTS